MVTIGGCLAVVVLALAPPELAVGTNRVAFDPATGGISSWTVAGQELVAAKADPAPFDLRDADGWLVGGNQQPCRLTEVITDGPRAVRTVLRCGDWQVAIRHELAADAPLLSRRAELVWLGAAPTTLHGFWFRGPVLAPAAGGGYRVPGAWPPRWYSVDGFQPGQTVGSPMHGAPIVVDLGTGRSVLAVNDISVGWADRDGASVREEADGQLWIGQSFQAQGHVRPGEPQQIGDAHLQVIDGDAEAALAAIWPWYERVGQRNPADRPDWYHQAVLYSFHPGGTIGSRFQDLGGFGPATEFLPEIAALGCNAIWLLPVEDRSPYHPRDYYRFQDGLGTPDEFRRLVATAQRLGLRVLMDLVPHGGSNTNERAVAHPEWLAQQPDGSTLDYWCFDFAQPTWQKYMAEVARHYVVEYGVDGYRVDACSGSKIPNWNPAVPYARASFAQLQGGLGMLAGLRQTVKAEKPDVGGLLAETRGSIYGTVSDAIYDFAICYQVLPAAASQPAAEYVANLRRWLHDQQAAELPDLIRLRHVESHDSLRAAGVHGLAASQAQMALTAWIHGMPLVYHGMETGQRGVLARIFAIRHALPELQGGTADYLSVAAPDGVFACWREAGGQGSVVLVNYRPDSLAADIVVPSHLLTPPAAPYQAESAWSGEPVTVRADAGGTRLTVPLARLGFTVVPLRPAGPTPLVPGPAAWPTTALETPGGSLLAGPGWAATVDAATGLLSDFQVGGQTVVEPLDLYLPPETAPAQVVVRREGDAVVAVRSGTNGDLTLRYEPTVAGLSVDASWAGDAPVTAAVALPVGSAEGWRAVTAEGVLDDGYRPRQRRTEGVVGGIYWRPQGGAVLWDSLLTPLPADGSELAARTSQAAFTVKLSEPPARAQWVERIGSHQRLTALLYWSDPEAPVAASRRLRFTLLPGASQPTGDPTTRVGPVTVTPTMGGWVVANAHYQLTIGRNGSLRRVVCDGREVATGGQIYTDVGYSGAGRIRYSSDADVEAAIRFWHEAGALRMRFEGQLRGSYRFDVMRQPIWYRYDYRFDDSPDFRLSWGIRPTAPPAEQRAFIALQLTLPGLTQITQQRAGEVLASGLVGDGAARVAETKRLPGAPQPDGVALDGAAGRLLTLTNLATAEPAGLSNVFTHANKLYLCWADGDWTGAPGAWRHATAVWTAGARSPGSVPSADFGPTVLPGATEILADGGFEASFSGRARGAVSGQDLPGVALRNPWLHPVGGELATAVSRTGHAAAMVVGKIDDYRLWRQMLDLDHFPPGSRWRLSGWARGQDLVNGDVNWKCGVIRLAVTTDRTTYVSSSMPSGSFDWRLFHADWTVPEGVRDLRVEVGLNGAAGTVWIDDLTLERLD